MCPGRCQENCSTKTPLGGLLLLCNNNGQRVLWVYNMPGAGLEC